MQEFKRYKITEIPEIRYRTREYRDSSGALQRTREEYWAYRPVKVVDGWARFGHYIIDILILTGIRTGLNYLLGFAAATGLESEQELINLQLQLSALGLFETLIYYAVFETIFASTPGKLLLGRMVIDEYGLKPDAGTIVLRSLSRMVPFEAFSCFSPRGWHDRWTKTFVVDKAEADLLWNLLSKVEKDRAQQDADNFRSQQEPGGF